MPALDEILISADWNGYGRNGSFGTEMENLVARIANRVVAS